MGNILFILVALLLVFLIWIRRPDLPIKKDVIVSFSESPRQWLKYAWIVTILAVIFVLMNVYQLAIRFDL